MKVCIKVKVSRRVRFINFYLFGFCLPGPAGQFQSRMNAREFPLVVHARKLQRLALAAILLHAVAIREHPHHWPCRFRTLGTVEFDVGPPMGFGQFLCSRRDRVSRQPRLQEQAKQGEREKSGRCYLMHTSQKYRRAAALARVFGFVLAVFQFISSRRNATWKTEVMCQTVSWETSCNLSKKGGSC